MTKYSLGIVVSSDFDGRRVPTPTDKGMCLDDLIARKIYSICEEMNCSARDIKIVIPHIDNSDKFLSVYRGVLERNGHFVWAIPASSNPAKAHHQSTELYNSTDELLVVMHKNSRNDTWIRNLIDPKKHNTSKLIDKWWINGDKTVSIAITPRRKQYK